MKRYLFAILFLAACSSEHELGRLEGSWREDSGTETFFLEDWTMNADNSLSGLGRMCSGKDTLSMERLRIEKKNDTWHYRVFLQTESGEVNTDFKLMNSIQGDSLVFENKENDFPAQIIYVFLGKDELTIYLNPASFNSTDKPIVLHMLRIGK
ncbi:MAG TPA: hypothetical protein DEP18_05315 [Flavobacteriales bacterium]|nr:hypothetical protein [Flavobacteriales bacterium]HCA83186.1 hypothetical protein [Flavobacteriales bacterium]HRE73347.1 DUF6265 family protein [Flavobacteriales bacterium]HRE95544.1 DUF6265 family protein [Flavobacteriales bacterium]HRJ35363.1 DUF6265 family protein [Flavobacteriales bacterium]